MILATSRPLDILQVMLLKKAVTKFKTAITDGESSTGNDSVAGGGGNRNYSALSNKSGLRERVLNGGGGVNVAIDNPGYTYLMHFSFAYVDS